MLTQRRDHDGFDLRRRHTSNIACLEPSLLHERMRDIVSIADAQLVGVRWGHSLAPVVEDTTYEQRRCRLQSHLRVEARDIEPCLHGFEKCRLNAQLMLAAVGLPAINDLADV